MNKKPVVIDVRTPAEFMGGNVAGSINIPLQEVPHRVEEIRKMDGPIWLCCASGNRSGQATAFLRANGIDCENAGSWLDVNYEMQTMK
ncbi:MAG: rhodanese-like domain-containing protein [Flavobacteriales bacterium]|nr:rhodanese-like domain-containing protein [Flavobacteriales bacterium]